MVNHIRIMVEQAEGSAKGSQVSNVVQYIATYCMYYSYCTYCHTYIMFIHTVCTATVRTSYTCAIACVVVRYSNYMTNDC